MLDRQTSIIGTANQRTILLSATRADIEQRTHYNFIRHDPMPLKNASTVTADNSIPCSEEAMYFIELALRTHTYPMVLKHLIRILVYQNEHIWLEAVPAVLSKWVPHIFRPHHLFLVLGDRGREYARGCQHPALVWLKADDYRSARQVVQAEIAEHQRLNTLFNNPKLNYTKMDFARLIRHGNLSPRLCSLVLKTIKRKQWERYFTPDILAFRRARVAYEHYAALFDPDVHSPFSGLRFKLHYYMYQTVALKEIAL